MNGMSCLISKPISPIYNPITRNKPKIIPCRSSKLHLKSISPLLANTRVLKHRVYSLSADHKDDVIVTAGSKSQIPQVSGTVLPYGLLGLIGITGLALLKAREVVALAPSKGWIEEIWKTYLKFLGLAAVFVATNVCLTNLVHGDIFSIGDIIIVDESVEGQVIDMGPKTTSLLTAENRRIVLPKPHQRVLNKSSAVCCPIRCKIFVSVDEKKQITVISREIENLIKSCSNLYSDDEEFQPYCFLSSRGNGETLELTFSGVEGKCCAGLIIGCRLKLMSEEELSSAKQELFSQIADLIKKHMGSIKSLRDIKCL